MITVTPTKNKDSVGQGNLEKGIHMSEIIARNGFMCLFGLTG